MSSDDSVLIYAINRTDDWWRYVAKNLGFSHHVVVSDIRGAADLDVVDEFNAAYKIQYAYSDIQTLVFTESEVKDIIARCRLLRWLPPKQARCMVAAMESAFTKVLDQVKPDILLSFPIDRYVSDVLERLSAHRGIPYVELTASLVSGKCMLLYRGQLVKSGAEPSAEEIAEQVQIIANPVFTPSYVKTNTIYSWKRWLKIFTYFKVRGWGFKIISILKRDLRSLHYLDAQSFLSHKPRIRDMKVLKLIDENWRDALEDFPKSKRIFFGLQLFPEASIDYWLQDIDLIDYENIIVKAAKAYSENGYLILVKDHPSQFGFRQHELIDRLKAIPNVMFLPYEVSGNEVISLVDHNFTLTGTLGMQASLLGLKSVVYSNYYSTDGDFIVLDAIADIDQLPQTSDTWSGAGDLHTRQVNILTNLMQGSFDGDFFSFKGFQANQPSPSVDELARNLGIQLKNILRVNNRD